MTIIVLFALLIFCNAFFIYKYLKLKEGLKSYEKIGTGRCGFYKYIGAYNYYNAYVYVIEIDRYTDGYSKIEIDKIEPLNKSYSSESNEKAKNNFISLKLTSEIEWLESEDHIKKLRKEKLDQINKI